MISPRLKTVVIGAAASHKSKTEEVIIMDKGKSEERKVARLLMMVNGKKVSIAFQPEPNQEAADFIKKTMLSAYTLRSK